MPSHLTRSVFRGLISNEGLILRCQHRPATFYRCQHGSPSYIRAMPQRTLFGFSVKPQRKAKDPDIIPGFAKMTKLNDMEKLQARLPPPEGLVVAFNEFIDYKLKEKEPINNIQAQHLFRTFKYLQQADTKAEGFKLTSNNLLRALKALTRIPNDETSTHVEFSKELYIATDVETEENYKSKRSFIFLIKILTSTGNSADARNRLERYCHKLTPDMIELQTELRKQMRAAWANVLNGFASENNEAELLRTLELASALGAGYLPRFREIMTTFYASRDNIAETKYWFNKETLKDGIGSVKDRFQSLYNQLTPELLSTLIKFCLRNNELDWCKSIVRDVLELDLQKAHWDIILLWAAGVLGKGVEDVERMMEVMAQRYPSDPSMRPDSETINGLVELAMSLDDPYLAERYISLGLKSGIRPNARTYILQMEYRIRAGDLTGTEAAYKALQGEEVTENEDLPVINKYIRALCISKASHYDRIISVVADLDERHARLEAETVSELCKMYLRRGELFEVVDILRANAFHHSLGERAGISNSLLAFCLDRSHATSQVWDTYTILKSIFPETDRGVRTQLMNEFFARKRCDMACHVFGHMRQHDRKEIRPVCETYVDCFEGIAQSGDRESLDMVHNMLKLDVAIEPTTRLYNSLMLAYTASDDADRAVDFWTDITNSREGPSYNSLEIVFLACAKRPFGDKIAREIWSRMRRMDIEVTPEVFSAFGAALAGQGKLDEVKSLIEGMEQVVGYGPDALTIGTFYNYTKGQNRKDLIEAWAKELYPQLWAELEKLGQREDEYEWRYFNIVREVKA